MNSRQFILLIFPLQLFDLQKIEYLDIKTIYIIEESYYFTRLKFHKQKLAYQRSTMKHYQQYIQEKYKHISVKYIDFYNVNNQLYIQLNKKYTDSLIYFDPIDKKIQSLLKKLLTNAQIMETCNYWISRDEIALFKRNKRYNFNSVYNYQKEKFVQLLKKRTDFNIYSSKSQDIYNRNKIPKSEVPSKSIPVLQQDEINIQSIKYINQHFKDNYGELTDQILYPVTVEQSLKWLKLFFKQRLLNFGKYQDAIDLENPYLYHSIISPMLNVGILTDTIVINELIKFLYKRQVKIPIQSLEAFLRQIIGWRNYVYLVYTNESGNLYKQNQFNHTNKLKKSFWDGQTGITVIDRHIQILNKTSYLNHIVRLMILGNFMLLLQIDPIEVLNWFTTMFIDSCDCLMVPNIIMSQNNSQILTTRIYISSFNYIKQMTNKEDQQLFNPEDEWKWNILFKGFLLTHKKIGLTSYVYASTTKKLLKLPASEQINLKKQYKEIISIYTNQSRLLK